MASDSVLKEAEARNVLRVRDAAISELTPEQRAALEHLPFLASLEYCTIYEHPPAQRAFMQFDAEQNVWKAAFYRERRWLGLLRAVEFVGFPGIEPNDVIELLRMRSAHAASFLQMHDPSSAVISTTWPHLHTAIDVIAALPRDKDEYFRSLGKQKRQQLPRYWRRVQREFNERVATEFRRNGEIDVEQIVRLVEFNQSRMAAQGKKNETVFESRKQRHRAPLTHKAGLLCTMEAEGRLLGGTFNYVHNDEAFLIVIAHDPALEQLNIGHICLWRTIEHLIDLGVTRYHLFWGKKLYKTQFGGIDHQVSMNFIARRCWFAQLARSYWMAKLQIPRAKRFILSLPRRLLNRNASKISGADADSEAALK